MRMESRVNVRHSLLVIIVATLFMAGAAHALDAPKWVGAFFVKGKVGLKWKAVDGAVSYNIYRKAGATDFASIGTTEKTQYFDTDAVKGEKNFYKIAAVGTDGAETLSSEKSVAVAGVAVGEFKPPVWIGFRFDAAKVFLNWEKVPGAIAYNVYRSSTPGSGYEVVGNPTRTKYADSDVEQGATYYYVLSALNEEFDETEMSEEREVKCGLSSAELAEQMGLVTKIELEDIPFTFLFEITESNKRLNQPVDVAVNSVGDIYITDALNYQVACYDSEGKFKFAFGEQAPNKDDPEDGTFNQATSLAIDEANNIWITDMNSGVVQKFTADGKFICRADITPGLQEGDKKFHSKGVAVLKDGRIVLSDLKNARLYYCDQNGKVLKSLGQAGGGPAEFFHPGMIAVTNNNEICVVDGMNYRVQVLDAEGTFIREFGHIGRNAGQFGRPGGIAIGLDKIWVTDGMGHTLQGFNIETGEVKYAASAYPDYEIRLKGPNGVFVYGDRLYMVNQMESKILVFKVG